MKFGAQSIIFCCNEFRTRWSINVENTDRKSRNSLRPQLKCGVRCADLQRNSQLFKKISWISPALNLIDQTQNVENEVKLFRSLGKLCLSYTCFLQKTQVLNSTDILK